MANLCGVGQPGHICGQPAVGMIASLAATREPGVRATTTLLCDWHFHAPPADWDPTNTCCGLPLKEGRCQHRPRHQQEVPDG